jgi:hypothetical protein
VQQAGEELGITADAVRMRVRRGSLDSEKGDDGRVHVRLDIDEDFVKSQRPVEGSLIEAKDETISMLREQLEAERDANRENRRIIAGLLNRIPELEPGERREDHARRDAAGDEGGFTPAVRAAGRRVAQSVRGGGGGSGGDGSAGMQLRLKYGASKRGLCGYLLATAGGSKSPTRHTLFAHHG